MRRLGRFYLWQCFHHSLYSLDCEGRSLAHYATWIGREDVLADILSLAPTLGNLQVHNQFLRIKLLKEDDIIPVGLKY